MKKPPKGQLLKWIGNKQRFAAEIVRHFPEDYGTFYEPFLGSASVLATLCPPDGVGSDLFGPLVGIWQAVQSDPELVKGWYRSRVDRFLAGDGVAVYGDIRSAFNRDQDPADFLFLCRACYGGVVRFRKSDGAMSTPLGPHRPMSADRFSSRVDEWHGRVRNFRFERMDYKEAMDRSREGDLVYCDPPYPDSQNILYGAHTFRIDELLAEVESCKSRGVRVALSIDGLKRSGDKLCGVPLPAWLFVHEHLILCGRSMLRRFQKKGHTLEAEQVADQLLLTY